MMYPFMTLEDGTEIVHSEMREDEYGYDEERKEYFLDIIERRHILL